MVTLEPESPDAYSPAPSFFVYRNTTLGTETIDPVVEISTTPNTPVTPCVSIYIYPGDIGCVGGHVNSITNNFTTAPTDIDSWFGCDAPIMLAPGAQVAYSIGVNCSGDLPPLPKKATKVQVTQSGLAQPVSVDSLDYNTGGGVLMTIISIGVTQLGAAQVPQPTPAPSN